jgi:hypothetical protein
VLSESWSSTRDRLELEVSGVKGGVYDLGLWSAGQLSTVEGAEWTKGSAGRGQLRIHIPSGEPDEYTRSKIVFHFTAKNPMEHSKPN